MKWILTALMLALPLIISACAAPPTPEPPEPDQPTKAVTEPPPSATATEEPTATPTEPPTPTATATQSLTVTPTPLPGETRTDEFGIEQVWVPAGTFMMGTDEVDIDALLAQDPPSWMHDAFSSEKPAHEVTLTSGYWIDAYEVTNRAFQAFVDAGGYEDQSHWSENGWAWLGRQDAKKLPAFCAENSPDKPRVCVTWYEAQAYAAWRGGRLPTEAEWEFAARGPESLIYPWGNEWDAARANVVDSDGLVKGGSYPDGVSWVGAYDMAGNAMEWVSDWLSSTYYGKSPLENPTGPEDGRIKVEKGGWWGSNPFAARSAYRHFEDPPIYQDHHIGFRIVTP